MVKPPYYNTLASAKMYLPCAFVGDRGRLQNWAKYVQFKFIRPRILYVAGGGPRLWAGNRNLRDGARNWINLDRLALSRACARNRGRKSVSQP